MCCAAQVAGRCTPAVRSTMGSGPGGRPSSSRGASGIRPSRPLPPPLGASGRTRNSCASPGDGLIVGTSAANADILDEADESDESEEETEEAQVCWSAVFGFLPVICEVGAEFAGAAMEAGICQYLLMLLLPLWSAIKALFGIVTHAAEPPAFAPPAAPPAPAAPDLLTTIDVVVFDFAAEKPRIYLLIDFALGFIVGVIFLYLKDINEWIEARQYAARQAEEERRLGKRGYKQLEEQRQAEAEAEAAAAAEAEEMYEFEAEEVRTAAETALELRNLTDRCELLDVRLRVSRKALQAGAEWAVALRDEARSQHKRREELQRLLGSAANEVGKEAKKEAAAADGSADEADADEESGTKTKKRRKGAAAPVGAGAGREAANLLQRVLKGPLMSLILRTVTGVMAISLYFMDIISDIGVIQLLWSTNNLTWAWMSIFLLVLQFIVVCTSPTTASPHEPR